MASNGDVVKADFYINEYINDGDLLIIKSINYQPTGEYYSLEGIEGLHHCYLFGKPTKTELRLLKLKKLVNVK